MIRVLHIAGAQCDFQARRGAESLRRAAGKDFSFVEQTLGNVGGIAKVATAILGLRARGSQMFDILHAWDGPSLAAAVLGGRAPVVYSPSEFPGKRNVNWLRAAMSHRDIHVVCPTTTMRRAYVGHGVPLDRCHLIRPGVDFGRVRRRRDPSLRAALGLTEQDHVVLAPGESTDEAAHDQAVWAGSILGVLDAKFKVLLWGRGPRLRRAARLGAQLGQPDLVRVAEERLGRTVEFEQLLPAADTVLVAARGPVATLPIATCMAAGLPIVSAVTYTVSELLEDRHTAVMAPKDKPRLLARRMLELLDDPTLQWSIADMARTEAYEYFSLTRFVDQYRTLYRQIAVGEKVDVPEPAPGAGLRFHGRA